MTLTRTRSSTATYGFALQEASLPFDGAGSVSDVGDPLLSAARRCRLPPHGRDGERALLLPGYDFGDEFDFGLNLQSSTRSTRPCRRKPVRERQGLPATAPGRTTPRARSRVRGCSFVCRELRSWRSPRRSSRSGGTCRQQSPAKVVARDLHAEGVGRAPGRDLLLEGQLDAGRLPANGVYQPAESPRSAPRVMV